MTSRGPSRERHLCRQIEKINDETSDQRVTVIVRFDDERNRMRQRLATASRLIAARRAVVTARDLVRRLPRSPARGRPTAEKVVHVPEALRGSMKSNWMKGIASRQRGSSAGPARKIDTAFSMVVELTKEELRRLPAQLPSASDVFPNRNVRLPPISRSSKLPPVVDDNKGYAWGVSRTGALACWGAYGARGKGVRIAILDTGVDPKHPDLRGKIADFAEFDRNGRIVTKGAARAYDSHGHGTHCAGTAVGGSASGRYIGMAPEAKVMAGLVLKDGQGTDLSIIEGIDWAIKNGADVISLSLGGLRMSADVLDTYTMSFMTANDMGIPVVVAVGNEGSQTTSSPGNDFFAFTVGATDSDDRAAGFSGGRTQIIEASRYLPPNLLPLVYSKPDVTAPGVDVYSAVLGKKWEAWNGSSMATPHVAGAFALLLSPELGISNARHGKDRVDLLQTLLVSTVKELGEAGHNHRYGYGRMDVLRAMGYARDLGY